MTSHFFTFPRFIRTNSWAFALAIVYLSGFLLLSLTVHILPLHYSPEQIDLEHISIAPFSHATHWLGTDQLGRDVLSNLLHGCRTALLVSVPAMLLAIGIGVVLGSIAGYFGDRTLRIRFTSLLSLGIASVLAYYYAFYLRQFQLAAAFELTATQGIWQLVISLSITSLVFTFVFGLHYLLGKWLRPSFLSPSSYLAVDTFVLKVIELLASVPNLVIILFLASITKPSILVLIFITGITYWTEPARLIRAQLLQIKQLTYVESARALGLPEWQILLKHALPNAMPVVIVAFTFGVAHLMALESTLSFLGVGVPPDTPSWGRMVMGIQDDFSAWWLVVFPGLMLCITVLALQTCTNYYLRKHR